jgi:hypothetical protein
MVGRLKLITLITLVATISPCVRAQRMVTGVAHFGGAHNRSGYARSSFFPLAFSDLFYGNDPLAAGYPVASQPPVIILQAPSAAAAPERPSVPNQPLMIELQGDRYVQVSGGEMADTRTSSPENIEPVPAALHRQEGRSGAESAAVAAKKLAPAVLVFRDGHREAVSNYTITDGVLYTSGDPYTGGSWNRKIKLSSLDLKETLKSNQEADVKFQLPTAPNEVIVRP